MYMSRNKFDVRYSFPHGSQGAPVRHAYPAPSYPMAPPGIQGLGEASGVSKTAGFVAIAGLIGLWAFVWYVLPEEDDQPAYA